MAWVKKLNQCSTLTVLLALTAAQMYDVSKIHVKHVYFFAPYFLMQFCFSFNYYDGKTIAIQHDAFAVADLGEAPRGPGHPPYF